ncbi:cupin domain-containing protein [Salinigranum rubrum]|uniref:Cupin domain-containing protein n=1 Tax=Salinigranum rubrum TaxID=755307 RepID=A0A2I8VJ87_9EURY|nr:cupin domain-containing protein [Salinigranum rubrum]AUV81980.1 cupin domain-containing protein [Salinigranum rubrum]
MSETWTKYDVMVQSLGAKLLVAPDESESGVAVVEHTLPPQTLGAPLHRHSHEDEISFVLEGTLGVQEGETVSTVEAGEIVVKERDVWHTFWNDGDDPLRFLEFISPGGFAAYFEEVADVLSGGPPDEQTMARVGEICARHDLEMDPESVPTLMERHGVDL